MKSTACLLVALSWLTGVVSAAEPRELYGYSDHTGEWKICIETARLNELPDLDPSKEPPPVTIPAAIAEAQRSLIHQFPQVKVWEFSEIIFEKVQVKSTAFWSYTVRFYSDPGTEVVSTYEAWVVMDGRALLRVPLTDKQWTDENGMHITAGSRPLEINLGELQKQKDPPPVSAPPIDRANAAAP